MFNRWQRDVQYSMGGAHVYDVITHEIKEQTSSMLRAGGAQLPRGMNANR